jgi:FkbM family methyltransferase
MFLYRFYTKVRLLPKRPLVKKNDGVVFEYDLGFDPEIKLMYYGLYEIDTVNAIRKYLKKGDTFLDVGANIGYISSVALRKVGSQGAVHSFEPVPEYYDRLKSFALKNSGAPIFINQFAAGQADGTAEISVSNVRNIGWNTIVPGYMTEDMVGKRVKIFVRRLDAYIEMRRIRNISLIKIDTEGFEFPVLLGLERFFSSHRFALPRIICEIAPAAYSLLGYSLEQLEEYMNKCGYACVELSRADRIVSLPLLKSTTNVLFIPR